MQHVVYDGYLSLLLHSIETLLWFYVEGGSVAEWFVRWTTKLATRVRSRVATGLPTGCSVLGGNLTESFCQQYRRSMDNRGGK